MTTAADRGYADPIRAAANSYLAQWLPTGPGGLFGEWIVVELIGVALGAWASARLAGRVRAQIETTGRWHPFVGDPSAASDRADLLERSPLTRVDLVRSPLLVFQGANDPRVTQAQSDTMVLALHRRGIPIVYLLAGNEGHSFGNRETSLAVNRATESFLAGCLGGRVGPAPSAEIQRALDGMTVDLDSLARRRP